MRTLKEIDRDIDDLQTELTNRVPSLIELDYSSESQPADSAAWQAAWEANPELYQRNGELYLERYDAFVASLKRA